MYEAKLEDALQHVFPPLFFSVWKVEVGSPEWKSAALQSGNGDPSGLPPPLV